LDLHNSGTYDFTEFQHLQLGVSPTDVKSIFYMHLYQADFEAGSYSMAARTSMQHIQGR